MPRDLSSRRAPVALDAVPAALLRRRLLAWYRRHRRAMPWRGTRDPYAVWVSEVMLQQTQVSIVLPYYRRFLARFPTVESLARARADDVLRAWAGLGYYRRARSLHAAAAIVTRDHAGRVPDEPETFGRLPGVGRYTVGAVLSICHDRPLPVLDGNVARVLSRLGALPLSIRAARDARALWALAASLVPMRHPGDWNQALMELGATLCTPRAPRCDACPVRPWCRAAALGRVAAYPPAAGRRPTEAVRRAVALVERSGRVLVARRRGALLAGLWEPPGVDLGPAAGPAAERRALGAALAALGVRARLEPLGLTLRHRITHRAIAVSLWRAVPAAAPAGDARLRWVAPERPGVALTALGRRALRGGVESPRARQARTRGRR